MTQGDSAVPTIAEIERRLQELSQALSAGRQLSHEEADRLRKDVGRLARAESLAPWRSAELHADVQKVVRQALPPVPPPVEVPDQRGTRRRTRQGRSAAAESVSVALPAPRRPPIDLDALFVILRERVDALHDAIEAGARPPRPEFQWLDDALTAFRRRADGPEIRQMLDDVRLLHRVVLAADRRSEANQTLRREERPRSRFVGQPSSRRRRLGMSRARRRPLERGPGAIPEEMSLISESCRLRDRAEKFAAARSAGRAVPLRESDRLFLHFRIVRPQVDADTRALNDTAVRNLVAAVVAERARAQR